MTEQLPLLCNGDAYFLTLDVGREVRLKSVVCYPNNQNSEGIQHTFSDLEIGTQAAIMRQIRRRHTNKTIRT